MNALLVIGAGGHGKVAAEAAVASGIWSRIAFLDRRFPGLSEAAGWPVIGSDTNAARFASTYPEVIVAIGDNGLRLGRIDSLVVEGFRVPSVFHPAAWVSPTAKVGEGTVVVGGAVINAGARIGKGSIVNTGATIDHDCLIGDAVHISPGAHLGGGAQVGDRTWVGIGASVSHCVKIGRDVIVGAGAAVIDDLPDGVTAVGVPARVLFGNRGGKP